MRMKEYITFALLMFLSLFNIRSSYSQNLIAFYPFDNNVKDFSGNNNNGKLFGEMKTTVDRFGNSCGALFFNGIDGYIEVPNSPSLQSPTTNFSISCWFKIENNSLSNGIKWLTLICKGDASKETPNNPQYRVQTFQSAAQSTISISSDFTEYDNSFQSHNFEYDKWTFYSLVYDGQFVKEYLNGQKIWEFPYRMNLTQNNSALYIGKDMPGAIELFSGSLDDLRIYDGALSESEIIQLFNDKSGTSFEDQFTLTCPNTLTVNTEKDKCFSIVNYPEPSLNVNCGSVVLKQIKGLPAGSQFLVGFNSIAYKAESSSGFKQVGIFNIVVNDIYPPEIKCQSDTTIYLNEDETKKQFYYTTPIATDNCHVDSIKMLAGIKSGDEYPVGLTKNIFRATDTYGNFSTCSFSVDVKRKLATLVLPLVVDTTGNTKGPDKLYYEYKDIGVKNCILTALMYDDGAEDFDTVSIFFNETMIVDKQMLKLKERGAIVRVLVLKPNEKNYLVSKAWNMGLSPPNTLKIEIYEGDFSKNPELMKAKKPNAVKNLHSKPGLSSAIVLKCN